MPLPGTGRENTGQANILLRCVSDGTKGEESIQRDENRHLMVRAQPPDCSPRQPFAGLPERTFPEMSKKCTDENRSVEDPKNHKGVNHSPGKWVDSELFGRRSAGLLITLKMDQ